MTDFAAEPSVSISILGLVACAMLEHARKDDRIALQVVIVLTSIASELLVFFSSIASGDSREVGIRPPLTALIQRIYSARPPQPKPARPHKLSAVVRSKAER